MRTPEQKAREKERYALVEAPRRAAEYARLKALGGEEYEAKLRLSREAAARQRERSGLTAGERKRLTRKSPGRTLRGFQAELVRQARNRERKKGLEATMAWSDLEWPEVCPVLGVRLNYRGSGLRPTFNNGNSASLDRWDNSRGYVPGNVYVISKRANFLKNNATPAELRAVAEYAKHGLRKTGALL